MSYFLIFLITQEDGGDTLWGLAFMWEPQAIMAVYLSAVYAVHTKYSRALSNCLSLVKNDHITSVNDISYILGIRQTTVKRRINRLIKTKFLEGAAVDDNEVVFKNSVWAKQKVSCRTCGAALIVDLGHTLVCEYCGGALTCVKQQYKRPPAS